MDGRYEKYEKNWRRGREDEVGGPLEQRLQSLFVRYMQKVHEEEKVLRGQGRLLRLLYHMGPISQKDLQERMGVQAGSMSEIAAKLERKGFIDRVRSEHDRRRMVLDLTPAGREAVERFREQHPHRHGHFEVLTLQEQQTLCEILEKLLQGWEK